MQYENIEDQPLVPYDPRDRYSRNAAHYKARRTPEWHERLQQNVFSDQRTSRSRNDQIAHDRPYARRIPHAASGPTYGHADPLTRLLPKILVALAIVFAAVAGYGALSDATSGSSVGSAVAEESSSPHSTASSNWTKGKMPYLYQTDDQWALSSYAGATVGDSGCGPTCMSMAYIYLTGKKDKDPAQMAAFSEAKGFTEGSMTTWAFMTEGARMLGLKSRELPADESIIRAELAAGHPIIVSVSPGDFTTVGHFIVLESTDAFGRILVRDPNSPERSAQAWDLSRILSQTRNLWALSV